MCSAGHLWSWVSIIVLPSNLHNMPTILALPRHCHHHHHHHRHHHDYSSPSHHCHAPPRLSALTNLHLGVVSSKTLEAVAKHKGFKKLVITGTKLTELPRELLAQVIANKREVDLCASELTDHQVEAIVEAVRPSSPLSSLTLKSVNLFTVKPASLQRMLIPLQELNICNCQITSIQVNDQITSNSKKNFVCRQRACSRVCVQAG